MTGATSETEARNWLGRIVAYNIADAWIAGPLPQVKLWQTDPQPIPDLSAEQWALLANPPRYPRTPEVEAVYEWPPVPEGVDEDVLDDLLEWFAGDGQDEFNIAEYWAPYATPVCTERIALAAEGYSERRKTSRVMRGVPEANEATAAHAVEVATGTELTRWQAEREANVAHRKAVAAWEASPEVITWRSATHTLAVHQSPAAVQARIQKHAAVLTGKPNFEAWLSDWVRTASKLDLARYAVFHC